MGAELPNRALDETTDPYDLGDVRGGELESASIRIADDSGLQEALWSPPESWVSDYEYLTWDGSVALEEPSSMDMDFWTPPESTLFREGYDMVHNHDAAYLFGSSYNVPDWALGGGGRPENSTLPHDEDCLSMSSRQTSDILPCADCPATFTGQYRKGNLARHQRLKHRAPSQTLYHCEDVRCPRSFNRQDARLKHYRRNHPHLAGISNGLKESADTDSHVHEATSSEHGRSRLTSPIGPDTAEQILHLKDIMDEEDESSSSSCSFPGLLHESRSALSMHQGFAAHDRNERFVSETPSCDISTVSDGDSRKADDDNYSSDLYCDICRKRFSRPADYRRHMRQHAAPTFQCVVSSCDKKFYRKDKWKDHIRQAHKEDTPMANAPAEQYPCETCGRICDTQGTLNQHISRIHLRRFACHLCDRTLTLRADLARHMHTCHQIGGVTYDCSVEGCIYKATRKDNLLRHIRNVHSDPISTK
jgi:uncharacterized Zn-finger protein